MDIIYEKIRRKIAYRREMLRNRQFYNAHKRQLLMEDKNKKVILMGTPEYGNMGDHLIALAELCLLKDKFGEGSVLEITENDIRYRYNAVKKLISTDSLLCLQGGGNISDIWTDQENIRSRIIADNSSNKIIVMPQTAYISAPENTPEILKKYKNKIRVCARERFTFELLTENNLKTMLCPDCALYLWRTCKKYRKFHQRNGIGVCIRDDAESCEEGVEEKILQFIFQKGYKAEKFSTVKERYISSVQREGELRELFEYVSGLQLVITDRLHAMIIAYLTGTACVALANSNRKVEGSYFWIENAENICFVKNIEEVFAGMWKMHGKENAAEFRYMELYEKIFE